MVPSLSIDKTHPAPAPASPVQRPPRYHSLDALRGIAALVVVLHHTLLTLPLWSALGMHGVHRSAITLLFAIPPLSLLWAGHEAVAVFFALSGFVLALMFLGPGPPDYLSFAVRRVCRIYIPYIVVMAIAMLLMTVVPHHTPELSEWFNASWNHAVTRPLILDHALMLGQPQYNFVDNPIWSLVHEMRYSLIFPLIMWLVLRLDWRLLAFGSLLVSVAAMGVLRHVSNNWAIDSLQYAFLFVTGATLAKYRIETAAWFSSQPPGVRVAIGITSLVLLGIHSLGFSDRLLVRAFAGVAPQIGALLLLIAVIGSGQVQRLLELKPCLWAGRVSYSLYLSHLVLLLTLVSLLHSFVSIYVILIALPGLALVLAGILNRLVEQPAINLGRLLGNKIAVVHTAH